MSSPSELDRIATGLDRVAESAGFAVDPLRLRFNLDGFEVGVLRLSRRGFSAWVLYDGEGGVWAKSSSSSSAPLAFGSLGAVIESLRWVGFAEAQSYLRGGDLREAAFAESASREVLEQIKGVDARELFARVIALATLTRPSAPQDGASK